MISGDIVTVTLRKNVKGSIERSIVGLFGRFLGFAVAAGTVCRGRGFKWARAVTVESLPTGPHNRLLCAWCANVHTMTAAVGVQLCGNLNIRVRLHVRT